MRALEILAITLALIIPQHARDSVAAVAVAREIIAADNARSLERVLATYGEHAHLMPPGEPPREGLAEIRRRYEALFAAFDPQIASRIDEVRVDGALATVVGHNGGRLRGRNGAPDRALNDWWLMVLGKNSSGAWKIHRLMWHTGGAR